MEKPVHDTVLLYKKKIFKHFISYLSITYFISLKLNWYKQVLKHFTKGCFIDLRTRILVILVIIYTNSNIHIMLLEKTLPVFYGSFQIAGTFTKGIYKKLSFYKLWSKFRITTLANFPQSVLCDEKYHILPYM